MSLANQIANMLARGRLLAANGAQKLRALQVGLLADDTVDDIEHVEPYGYTAEPLPGAEVFAAFFDGDRSHGVVLSVADRRFRPTDLKPGEVAIYNHQGQMIVLGIGGIEVRCAGRPLTIKDAEKVRCETALLECTGQIKDLCDTPQARTMAHMRDVYNIHTHPENDQGGPTDPPNQQTSA